MKESITIKEVSELLGISTDAIRLYEKEGLVKPYRNPNNGYRYYDSTCVQRIMGITLYRRLNASLKEVDSLLHVKNLEELIAHCKELQMSNNDKIKELESTNQKLTHMSNHMEELLKGLNQCQIKELPRFYTPLLHRDQTADYDSMWEAGRAPYFSYGNECYELSQRDDGQVYAVAHMYALREEMMRISPIKDQIEETPYREEGTCVYQVICSDGPLGNSESLQRMRDYATEHEYSYKNYIYCFYIISLSSNDRPLNYYELYLPVSKV